MNHPSTLDIVAYVLLGAGFAFLSISLTGAIYFGNRITALHVDLKLPGNNFKIAQARKNRSDALFTALFGAILMLAGVGVFLCSLFNEAF